MFHRSSNSPLSFFFLIIKESTICVRHQLRYVLLASHRWYVRSTHSQPSPSVSVPFTVFIVHTWRTTVPKFSTITLNLNFKIVRNLAYAFRHIHTNIFMFVVTPVYMLPTVFRPILVPPELEIRSCSFWMYIYTYVLTFHYQALPFPLFISPNHPFSLTSSSSTSIPVRFELLSWPSSFATSITSSRLTSTHRDTSIIHLTNLFVRITFAHMHTRNTVNSLSSCECCKSRSIHLFSSMKYTSALPVLYCSTDGRDASSSLHVVLHGFANYVMAEVFGSLETFN